MNDLYERLAKHLDSLPAGFPRTASGVELRILRRLFTPEDAELALQLSLIADEPRVIARRTGLPVEVVAERLADMERRGLIYGLFRENRAPRYMIYQFAVGFWEGQVNRLDADLVRDFEEYLPSYSTPDKWRVAPQLRTVPVGESITHSVEAMPYERAEEIVGKQDRISVANCICRQEMAILGHGCGRLDEACLAFGTVADHYVRTGRGRAITQEEALAILRRADEQALVLQPSNNKDPMSICACCGCCCGVLRSLKTDPEPATVVASPFRAALDNDACATCGLCVERCQMDALALDDAGLRLDTARCIGCGLCITTCQTGALTLVRKPEAEQPHLPANMIEAYIRWAGARGQLGGLVKMQVRSSVDRVLSPRDDANHDAVS